MNRPPFRRRNFFIKQGFQLKFAFFPILFLTIFLVVSGIYLKSHLEVILKFQLYLPHSHLENPWDEVFPELVKVAAWGGGVFLAVLSVWCWVRFSVLKRSLIQLADWVGSIVRGEPDLKPPVLKEREAAKLAENFSKAAEAFSRWDKKTDEKIADFIKAVEALDNVSNEERISQLSNIRNKWHELWSATAEVRVDEGLS